MILLARSRQAKEIEILVLRHQLAILDDAPHDADELAGRPSRPPWPDCYPRAGASGYSHARHHPALAPATRRPRLDHPTHAARATTTPLRPLRPCRAPGHGEFDVKLPTRPPRTRPPRLPGSAPPLYLVLRSAGLDPSSPHPDPAGPSSCEPRRTGSWPATRLISTPSPCTGSCLLRHRARHPPRHPRHYAHPTGAWLTRRPAT